MIPNTDSPEFLSAISVKQMQDSDRYTIEHLVQSKELMYRAALGVYKNVDWSGKKIAIVCGSGNNAGDGYALASILKGNGITSDIVRTSPKFSEDGLYYYQMAKQAEVTIFDYPEEVDFCSYDIIVDCILGTGFKGVPRENIMEVINRINQSGAYTVSVDINSGLNGDTGEAVCAVKSDLTVSIGYYKKGLFLGKAPELIGDIVNVDIGIVLI